MLTNKFSNMSITITQAPSSDFTGTSLAVLKGAKELSTDKFLYVTVFGCQLLMSEKGQWICHALNLLTTGYLIKFLT